MGILVCGPACADASAWVQFTGSSFANLEGTTRDYEVITAPGVVGFEFDTSGAVFGLAFDRVTVRQGESVDLYIDYVIRVQDDGLPAARDWGYCAPISFPPCSPAPTGFEQATVRLTATNASDSRFQSLYLTVTGESVTVATDGGSFADGVTQSGRLHVNVEASSLLGSPPVHEATIMVYALATVDAGPVTPVPEPATVALLLAGLGAVALKARHRAR